MSRALSNDYRKADFEQLLRRIREHPLMQASKAPRQQPMQMLRTAEYRSKCVMRASLDDIALGINLCKIHLDDDDKSGMKVEPELPMPENRRPSPPPPPKSAKAPTAAPFIKVLLRKTPLVVLYERRSMTVLADSEEGLQVLEDNKRYDELLAGTDKTRRTVDADTQTIMTLNKSRLVNTERLNMDHVGSYVSNFEMFDTYKDLETSTKSVQLGGEAGGEQQQLEITTYTVGGVDQFVAINNLPSFKVALMLTMRILASNVFEPQQRRFRNMAMPDALAEDVKFKYRLQLLWRLDAPASLHNAPRAVSDISFCPCNGDIMAVAYGIYSHAQLPEQPKRAGWVYVWNIKNPVNPERCYNYTVPVVTVEFSPTLPQLLAVGLQNGDIELRDISRLEQPPLAVTQRCTSPFFEAVTAIRWVQRSDGDVGGGDNRSTPFLAASQAGAVTKYRLINSPHLLGMQQQHLQRAEGELEGIEVEGPLPGLLANRHVQCLELALDPVHPDIYYVLTDEGTLYKCSTNYPLQHLELRQAHEAPAVCMEFCPWSPKLYLTCGGDWCIRIWLAGILVPIITLRHHMAPVHCARWSRTHATILVSLTRTTVDIWDLRNSVLKPVSTTSLDAQIFYTTFQFAHCGRSMAVGNEAGNLLMLALEDMPFPPHFQYKQLKRAIYQALSMEPTLKQQVMSVGYFGYPGGSKQQ